MDKTYRRIVKKIPLTMDIEYIEPEFPPMETLFLDLLENPVKLKKNPPKPIFVYPKTAQPVAKPKSNSSSQESHSQPTEEDDDFDLLDELEKKYDHSSSSNHGQQSDSDQEHKDRHDAHENDIEQDPDLDSHEKESSHEKPSAPREEYDENEFKKEQAEEENEEQKLQQRIQDLLFKFMVLKRQYPKVDIPDFTEHSDITLMQRTYDNIIRSVSLDSSLAWYKKFLMGSWLVIEYVCVEIIHLDMTGFASHQVAGINEYDALLLELGEKHSSLTTMFPVEVRLIFLVLFNAVIFLLGKMILGGGNGAPAGKMNVLNTIMSMMMGGASDPSLSGATNANPNAGAQKKRGTMRGPTITPNDVENFAKRTNDQQND